MDKKVKILSVLLTSIIGLGLSSTKVIDTKDNKVLIVKDILKANEIEGSGNTVTNTNEVTKNNIVSKVLAQVNTPTDGKIDIRFVAGIDSYTYGYAQFNITLKDTNGDVVINKAMPVSHAYLGVAVKDEIVYATNTEYFGEGCNYLIAYTLTGVPSDFWDYKFEVTASIGNTASDLTATSSESSTKVITNMIENDQEDDTTDAQPISIDEDKTKVDGSGIHIYLVDKPAITMDDINVEIVSFESTQFAGYKDAIMAGATKVHYVADQGWFLATVANGFPNGGDQVMVVKISYLLDGVSYSQELKFVGNAYQVQKSLEEVKLDAITELEGYADENYYSSANWALVETAIVEGTTAINNATTETEVESALESALNAIDAITKDNLGETKPISIDETKTKVEGAGVFVVLKDKPAVTMDDINVEIVSFESNDYPAVADQVMANKPAKVYYNADGTLYFTIAGGVPNGCDAVMVVKISYLLDGVSYSQELKFVGNAYKAQKSLEEVKLDAITELEGYANKDYYSSANWALVETAIVEGTTAINNATTETEVESALENALKAIDTIKQDNLGETQPIAIDETKTKVEGSGIHIYLVDKPAITMDDISIEIVSFESTQFAGYKDAIMAGATKVHYVADQGWFLATVANGFPNEGDQVMVVKISYVFNGTSYSQEVKFVGNAYQA